MPDETWLQIFAAFKPLGNLATTASVNAARTPVDAVNQEWRHRVKVETVEGQRRFVRTAVDYSGLGQGAERSTVLLHMAWDPAAQPRNAPARVRAESILWKQRNSRERRTARAPQAIGALSQGATLPVAGDGGWPGAEGDVHMLERGLGTATGEFLLHAIAKCRGHLSAWDDFTGVGQWGHFVATHDIVRYLDPSVWDGLGYAPVRGLRIPGFTNAKDKTADPLDTLSNGGPAKIQLGLPRRIWAEWTQVLAQLQRVDAGRTGAMRACAELTFGLRSKGTPFPAPAAFQFETNDIPAEDRARPPGVPRDYAWEWCCDEGLKSLRRPRQAAAAWGPGGAPPREPTIDWYATPDSYLALTGHDPIQWSWRPGAPTLNQGRAMSLERAALLMWLVRRPVADDAPDRIHVLLSRGTNDIDDKLVAVLVWFEGHAVPDEVEEVANEWATWIPSELALRPFPSVQKDPDAYLGQHCEKLARGSPWTSIWRKAYRGVAPRLLRTADLDDDARLASWATDNVAGFHKECAESGDIPVLRGHTSLSEWELPEDGVARNANRAVTAPLMAAIIPRGATAYHVRAEWRRDPIASIVDLPGEDAE